MERREMSDAVDLSVIIPVHNEEESLVELYERIVKTLEPLGVTFEIVAIDDGSTDESLRILIEIHDRDKRLRIVQLARNFGQTAAVYAGFAHVRGEIICQMDADLQNPPEELPKLLEKLDEGFDAVQGWREERRDSIARRLPSRALNQIISRLIGAKLHDLGCGMRVYRRKVVEQLAGFTHQARYVPAETLWLGAKLGEVKIQHNDRKRGVTKYGFLKLLHLNFNIVTSVSTLPVKLVGAAGCLFSFVGFSMGTFILARRIIDVNFHPLASAIATVMALLFILGGTQLVAVGIMCEYISRIFDEVQGKPYYVVARLIE